MRRLLDLVLGVSLNRLEDKYAVVCEKVDLDGVPAEIISSRSSSARTLLYLHGGGYFMGSLLADRANAAKIAIHCDARVAIIDYRLAPENPYPAALEDAVRGYRELKRRDPGRKVIICGDSAGGGLALALGLYLRDHGLPAPAGIFCISPWTDLTGSGRSVYENRRRDVWLTKKHIDFWGPWYFGTQSPRLPYVSPVFGDFRGFSPLLLLVGDQEVLLDDARRVAESAKSVGVDVDLHLGSGMQHNWMLAMPFLGESKIAWTRISKFVASIE